MKKFFLTLHFLYIFLFATTQNIQTTTSYQPPHFTDANRIEKIKATLPVIDRIYKEYAEKNHFPGFVYGIVADGKLIHTGTYGHTDISKKIAVTTQSDFRIASMTKSITALAILKLRDAGKLKLDDPVYLYIPEMKNQSYATKDAPVITIRNLLTHSAGFPEDNPWGDRQLADTDHELIDLIKNGISFSNAAGIAYEYSNLGFAMLGYIIKKVSGKPFDQYINENILKPLGMNNTYWEYTKIPLQQLAHGYRWINGQWQEEELLHHGSHASMGGLITTMEDFAKYVALHLSAWPPRNDAENSIAKRSSLREMHHPWRFNTLNTQYRYPGGRPCALAVAYGYGLGWSRDCEGRIRVGHSGGLPGFGSYWGMLPDYGIAVISFANVTYAPTTFINIQVLDTILALTKLQPRQLPASKILNQRKNELVALLPDWKNAEQSKIFAENFFPDYTIDSLRKEATHLFAKAGKIVRIHDMVAENQLRGSFIMEGEKANIEFFFTLTPENPPLIQEYHIREIKKL